jgi:hypothetical protein
MPYDAEVLADSPYLYWKLDDVSGTTAADASGNSRTGTYVGDFTLNFAPVAPELGARCVNFNGSTTTGYVHRDVTDFPTGDLTIEVWFRHTDAASLATDTLVSVSSGTHTNAFLLFITDSNSPRITVANNGNTLFNASGSMDSMRHAHLVVTWVQATGAFVMYLNGAVVQTGTLSAAAVISATANIMVAQDNNAAPPTPSLVAGSHWAGRIQNVALYPAALSEARVQAHYLAGSAPTSLTYIPIGEAGVPSDLAISDLSDTLLPEPYRMQGHDIGGVLVELYTNKVFDSVAGNHVVWRTALADAAGAFYPGPGTWGVHTSDYRVSFAS